MQRAARPDTTANWGPAAAPGAVSASTPALSAAPAPPAVGPAGDGSDSLSGWEPLGGPVADVLAARQSVEVGFPSDELSPFAPGGGSAAGPERSSAAPGIAGGGRAVGRFTPVRHRDRIVAVIGVLRPAPAPPFTPADRRLLDAVVERVEAALELQDVRDELTVSARSGISQGSGVVISEALLERLARVGGDVLFAHRFGAGTTYVSPGVERVLGYAPAEFLADPTLAGRIVHPDDRHLVTTLADRPDAFERPLVIRASPVTARSCTSSPGCRRSPWTAASSGSRGS